MKTKSVNLKSKMTKSSEVSKQFSLLCDSEINSDSDVGTDSKQEIVGTDSEWEVEGTGHQSCSDFSQHHYWESIYSKTGISDEEYIKFLLSCHVVDAKAFLMVRFENLKTGLNKYMLPLCKDTHSIHENFRFIRLNQLLCISRIFLNQDREDQFRFLCSLAEKVMKYQSEEIILRTIDLYLDIQLQKNPLCTFDDLSTGISDPLFKCKLTLIYCTQMHCKTQSNGSDQSIEEKLKYFIPTFDDVTHYTQLIEKTRIFYSFKQILDKLIAQKDDKNMKITFEVQNVLQMTIRNIVIDDCFKIFKKYMFRNRWFSLSRKQKLKMIYVKSLEEKLLRLVCGFVIEFLQHLKLIEKTLHTDMQVSTMLEENKCILRCLVETLSYILAEEDLRLYSDWECELSKEQETLIFHLDEDKETILPIYLETILDCRADKRIVNIIKEFCEMGVMNWKNKEIIRKSIYDIASVRYHKQRSELAKVILDINLSKAKGNLLIQITLALWDLLKIRDRRKGQTHQNTMQTELQHKTILYRCICILRNAKKREQLSDVNITNYTNIFNLDEQSLDNKDQVAMKSNTEIMLITMLLLLVAATRHHKSAKLKKYLSQKYEYKEALLYILWCSGDIQINPGPPMKKSQLLHDSQRERAWTQDMSSILLKLYKGEPPHSKPKNLWREKPEHWPSNKPFYDTKNHPHDEYGCFISDIDLLKCLIQCCDHRNVHIHNMYKKEIAAWTENKSQLLHKLHTFRTEIAKIKMVLQNFIIYKDTDDLKEAMDNIHVKLSLKVEESYIRNVPCKRKKNQTEILADITRYIATVVCKIVKGKDPESKCDGIWTTPPKQWPPNVPFFSPFNRGKCKHTCSDHLLVSTLLQHPKAVIPPKYKSLVESYQNVVNAIDKKEAKKHKEVLCRVKTIQTEVSVLDYALTYLHSDGFFTTEVCHPLHQWWSSQNVENQTEIKFANLHRISEERPKIRIEVTRKCMTLSVNMDYPTKSQVYYNISFDDSLPTTLDSNSQHCSDIDQLRNDDNSQGISVNKNSQIQQKSSSEVISLNGSNHGTDSQPSSLINIDTETDFSVENGSLFTVQTQSPAEYHSLSFSELKKSKENTTSPKVRSLPNREETVAKDSDGTNYPTKVSGINTGQSGDNPKFIVPGTTKSYELTTKMSKGQKRKYSNESNGNGISKSMLMENDIQDDCVQKKTREEAVSDHQLDLLLESCIDDISFQHKSTSELSKNESSMGSAEDEIMDISLPVSTDYDEVNDGLEILLGDLINYESGKTSILEKELLLDSS